MSTADDAFAPNRTNERRILAAAVAAAIALASTYFLYGHREGISHARYDQPLLVENAQPHADTLKWIYEERKKHYDSAASRLGSMVLSFAAVTLLVVLILYFGAKDITAPLLNVKIPRQLAYLLIPCLIIYLWFQFGFVLFAAADERNTLTQLANQLELHDKKPLVTPIHQASYALEDGGLLDLWAYYFHKQYQNKDYLTDCLVAFSFYGVYGTLCGALHASLFTVLFEAARYKIGSPRFGALTTWAAFVVLLVAHAAFAVRIPGAMLWQATIWLAAAIGIVIYRYQTAERVYQS